MRWEFVGGESASLGSALRALAEKRGWGEGEAESLLAGLGPSLGSSEAPAGEKRDGDPPAMRREPARPSAALFGAFRGHHSYRAARERIGDAVAKGHRIVLFGDYDADGITAVAQVHRFLVADGQRDSAVSWFVPNRMRHGYGLTRDAAHECLATCREEWARGATGSPGALGGRQPSRLPARPPVGAADPVEPPILLIALDCGSASPDVIGELKAQGIDCIVVDHHEPPDLGDDAHPAVAHLNPHAWIGDDPGVVDLRLLSASGLAFCLCAELARDRQVKRWDRAAGLVLAGLGTVADVVPLTGPNRRLVKMALGHANEAGFLERRLPGLAKLHELSGGGAVDARTLGYRWGPRVNASGRIEDARQPVELLLATDPKRISELARACEKANEDRKERTARVLEDALQLAARREESGAQDRVLVLWDESWEPGVVGIVAGRLRERMGVPAIVLGKHPGQQVWKGSGRSVGGYDLGAEVRHAAEAGLVLQGGGHPQAAGLTVACGTGAGGTAHELETLRAWINDRCSLDAGAAEPVHEVLALVHADEAMDWVAKRPRDPGDPVRFWCEFYDRLEPFGAGNPRPGLLLRNAEMVACQAKTTMKRVEIAEIAESTWEKPTPPGPPIWTAGLIDGRFRVPTEEWTAPPAPPAPPVPRTWALSAHFRTNGAYLLVADWTDPEAARAVWPDPKEFVRGATPAIHYDLILEPHCSTSAGKQARAPRTWYDWRVVACAPSPGDRPRSGAISG